MTTKHTPGPWRVPARSPDTIAGPNDILIAVASDADVDLAIVAANARLIASAPDLLAERDRIREALTECFEACKAMSDPEHCMFGRMPPQSKIWQQLADRARAALKGE